MDDAYKCLMCNRTYYDEEVVIGLLSEESKKELICEKLYYLMRFIVSIYNSPMYICRACYGQVQVSYIFLTKGQKNQAKLIENLKNSPSDNAIRKKYNKIQSLSPFDYLLNKYQFDVKRVHDATTNFLNDDNENLSSSSNFEKFAQYFGINNHNSITNQSVIESIESIGNGIPESPPVPEVNMLCTNEPNIDTNNIDNIYNSSIDLNNPSFRPIINTNNVNHETNSSIHKNILLNSHIPITSSNNLSNTVVNPSSNVLHIITKYSPNVGTNNVNNILATNNINQSRINLPIVCKNNVIKSSRFCVLSKPPLLITRRHVETNTVQNLGSATRLNQSNINNPCKVKSTVNNHNNSVQLNTNGEINDDEVICLDDDDDDDDDDDNHYGNNRNHNDTNNNGNGNNLQGLENSINPLNQWVLPPPPLIINNNTNNNATTIIPKSYQRKKQNNAKKLIQFERKVIYLRNNAPSTNVPTEEMTVTPDMPLSTSNVGSSSNQEEDMDIDTGNDHTESLQVETGTEPSRVLPDTGFHFLFSTNETVDLTTKEDNTPKKTPIIKQKKTPKPKKAVASKKPIPKTSIALRNREAKNQLIRSSTSSTIEKKQTRNTSIAQYNLKAKGQLLLSSTSSTTEQLDTSLTKPRPKRASAINSAAEIKNSGLFKLGKHMESKDGNWITKTTVISLTMYRCPICDKYYYSSESRQVHEIQMHSLLLESIHKPLDTVSTPGNTACTQQLDLFNYLQLCSTSKHKTKAVHQLAKRTNLLKAFKTIGLKIIDFFKCNYCPFHTNLMFALWAHMTSNHLNCDFEKKSCLFCFLCSRMLTKRTTLLKHVDGCVIKHNQLTINNSCNRLMCAHCDDSFDSLSELEEHGWFHFKRY